MTPHPFHVSCALLICLNKTHVALLFIKTPKEGISMTSLVSTSMTVSSHLQEIFPCVS